MHRTTQHWKNAAFVAADIALVLTVAAGARWWWINRTPDIKIPAVPLPNPNGYERLTQAVKGLKHSDEVGHAIGRQIDSSEHVYTQEEKEQLLTENVPALTAFRAALQLPMQAPPLHSFDDRMPEFARFRALARLLSLEGEVHEEHSEWKQAADSYLDAMELGIKVQKGGVIIHQLVGIACQAIGLRPLVPLTDKLSPAEAGQVLARLNRLEAERTPFYQSLDTEKWWTEEALLSLFRKYSLSRTLVKLRTELGGDEINGQPRKGPSLWERGTYVATAFVTSKQDVLKNYSHCLDEQIALSQETYDRSLAAPKVPTGLYSAILMPVFSQARYKDLDIRAHTALLEGKLLLKTQESPSGAYPITLTGLPRDPFARNGTDTLRYRRVSSTAYRLYSVGPDGKDDGGKPIAQKDSSGKIRRWSQSEDNGDIVLGVDLY
jgi:hypothetical protein